MLLSKRSNISIPVQELYLAFPEMITFVKQFTDVRGELRHEGDNTEKLHKSLPHKGSHFARLLAGIRQTQLHSDLDDIEFLNKWEYSVVEKFLKMYRIKLKELLRQRFQGESFPLEEIEQFLISVLYEVAK